MFKIHLRVTFKIGGKDKIYANSNMNTYITQIINYVCYIKKIFNIYNNRIGIKHVNNNNNIVFIDTI